MLDTLRDFPAEDGPGPIIHPRSDQGQSLTIAELLSRSVFIEWYEAVAISQAVCDKLRASGDDDAHVHIGPEQVSIDDTGEVQVAAIRAKDGPNTLGEVSMLLRTMLAETNIPTRLRLTLSQTAVCPSLREWSATIAYYERPDRAEVIRALYQRARNLPLGPVVGIAPVLPVPPLAVPEESVQRVTKPQTRHVGVIATAVIVSLIAAGGVWVVQTRRPNERVNTAGAQQDARTLPAGLNTAAAVVETLVKQIPLIGSSRSELDTSPPTLPGGRWIHLRAAQRSNAAESVVRLPISRSFPLDLPSTNPSFGGVATDGDAPSDAAAASPAAGLVPRIIYSVADADVMPPVAVYPQFPSIPSGTDANDVAEFEVVVTQSGEVESVKARRVPASIAEALTVTMSLSAAKTWRFSPGLRNGEPVKYLKVISILKN